MARNECSDNHCPVFYAISRLGDKWSLLIIRDLMFFAKRYYSEFLNSTEGISTNILASRLRQLEHDGIITKRVDPQNKSKMVYSLTEKGKALMPVLLEIVNWSAIFDAQTEAPPEFVRALRNDREGLQKTLDHLYEQGTSIRDAMPGRRK